MSPLSGQIASPGGTSLAVISQGHTTQLLLSAADSHECRLMVAAPLCRAALASLVGTDILRPFGAGGRAALKTTTSAMASGGAAAAGSSAAEGGAPTPVHSCIDVVHQLGQALNQVAVASDDGQGRQQVEALTKHFRGQARRRLHRISRVSPTRWPTLAPTTAGIAAIMATATMATATMVATATMATATIADHSNCYHDHGGNAPLAASGGGRLQPPRSHRLAGDAPAHGRPPRASPRVGVAPKLRRAVH